MGEQFEAKFEAALRVAKRLPPTILAELDRTGLGNDPKVIRYLAGLGESMAGAQDAINVILGDKTHPYQHPFDPRNAAAKKEMARLYQKLYGSRPVS